MKSRHFLFLVGISSACVYLLSKLDAICCVLCVMLIRTCVC